MGKENDHSKYARWIDPKQVKPYEKNAKIHTEKQIKNICNSIKRFGWQQDTVLTSDFVLVIGHGRREAALKLGCEMPYHIIDKTADELTDDDIRELRIADNQTNAETGFDFSILEEELEGLDFIGFDFDFNLLEEDEQKEEKESIYTNAVNIPQYEPTGDCPSISDMLDETKYNELINNIEQADIPEDIKEFLGFAAARHLAFNYKYIANFYAHQPAEIQRLMEESALVIIDVDDAIANGYAELKHAIDEMIEEDDDEG